MSDTRLPGSALVTGSGSAIPSPACPACDGAGGHNVGWSQTWTDCRSCGATGRLTAENDPRDTDPAEHVDEDRVARVMDGNSDDPGYDRESALAAIASEDDDAEYMPACPACGDPVDYCQGHGESGDPDGFLTLSRHDDGDHEDCHEDGCEDAGTTTLRTILTRALADGEWHVMGYNVGGLFSWQGDPADVPTAGDTAYAGYNAYVTHDSAYREHRTDSGWLAYLSDAAAVRIVHTTYGDYTGDDVTRSNCRALADDSRTVLVSFGGYGTECVALPLDDVHPADELRSLVDSVRALADEYPLWDEDDHSSLVMDMEDDDWSEWAREDARRDYRDALVTAGMDEDDADRMADDADLTAWLTDWREDGTVQWEAESAVSGYFRGLTDALTARAQSDAGL